MPVIVCSGCQSKFKVKPELVGRRIKCPRCKITIEVVDEPDVSAPRKPSEGRKPARKSSPKTPATIHDIQPSGGVADDEFPVLPLAPGEPSTAGENENRTAVANGPAISIDTGPTSKKRKRRRRKSRSSMAIWLPMMLVLAAVAGVMVYFLPSDETTEVVVKPLPDQYVIEGQEMKLAISASGSNQPVKLSIVEAPTGATLNQATREFQWTPSEADGPGEFNVTVRMTGSSTTDATFRVIVAEHDAPPVFEPVQSIDAIPTQDVSVQLAANDPDEPGVTVSYSLASTESEFAKLATIDKTSGRLNFVPPENSAGELIRLGVIATEESSEALSTELAVVFQVAKFEDPIRQLLVDFNKTDLNATIGTANDNPRLPFTGKPQQLEIAGHSLSVFQYPSRDDRQSDIDQVDELGQKLFDEPWQDKEPLYVFAKNQLLVASIGGDRNLIQLLSRQLDQPIAVVQTYEAPAPVVKQTPALIAVVSSLYEERMKRPGKPRKLFATDSYAEVRKVFSDEFEKNFDSEIRNGLGDDYDEVMTWFKDRVDLKEEFFTAIRPDFDDVASAVQLFNEIRKTYPRQIERYGSLAIACSVVWDNDRGIYGYGGHARRTHSIMPDTLLSGLENFRYFVEAENVMQGRAQYIPWEFLVHLVNHKTPAQERVWAVQAYVPTRQMFGKCYADVPYDTTMLKTKSRECKLDGKEYNLPNLKEFGGVCAMQADFAARVGKSIGVPAEYVSGSGRYGGAHAWVMWVELHAVSQRSIKFTLESHGRYRGDHYYVGNLKDPQTGRRTTDRMLELRLHQVGTDALAKRHADRLMALYPQLSEERAFDFNTHLEYLSGVVGLNAWNEDAWTALSQVSSGREISRTEHKTMTNLLNQLFVNFAAFPDFTLTIFDDLVSFEKDVNDRIPYYYQLLEVYSAAKRPDLGFNALLKLSGILEQQDRSAEAIQALAVAIQKYPDEGQYIPKMLDKLEQLASADTGVDQTLAEFYASFLPKIPQKRGSSPSKYCMQMYERAVPVFERAGQQQLAQRYQAGATQMKAGIPQ